MISSVTDKDQQFSDIGFHLPCLAVHFLGGGGRLLRRCCILLGYPNNYLYVYSSFFISLQLNGLLRLALEEQKSRKASTTEGSSWLPAMRFNSVCATSLDSASR